ncbi:MAG: hypothetical protein WC750_04110 [Patescibacteria group bacterium]|jgi:hypothetical protein
MPPVKPKLGLNALSCVALIFAAVVLSIIGLAFAVAKSGFLDVPIFDRFYHGPTPTRLIQASPLSWDAFSAELASKIYEQREYKKPSYTVQVSEQELSGLIQSVAKQNLRNGNWKVELVQLAVNPDYMELYIKLAWRETGNLDMLFRFKPLLDERGNIRFDLLETRVGDYRLPTSWGMALASNLFARDLGAWELKIGGQNAIQSVSLLEKGLNIILSK